MAGIINAGCRKSKNQIQGDNDKQIHSHCSEKQFRINSTKVKQCTKAAENSHLNNHKHVSKKWLPIKDLSLRFCFFYGVRECFIFYCIDILFSVFFFNGKGNILVKLV